MSSAVTGTPSTTVIAYGTPLVDDPERIGHVTAVGLDKMLFARQGPWRTQAWSTSIADVASGQLLDVIEGRSVEADVLGDGGLPLSGRLVWWGVGAAYARQRAASRGPTASTRSGTWSGSGDDR